MQRQAYVTVQHRFEIASESMTDSRLRNVEREMSRSSVVMIRIRKSCEIASVPATCNEYGRLTILVDDNLRTRMIESPTFLNLFDSQPSATRAEDVRRGEHDDVGPLGRLDAADVRRGGEGRNGDIGVQLGRRNWREEGRVRGRDRDSVGCSVVT